MNAVRMTHLAIPTTIPAMTSRATLPTGLVSILVFVTACGGTEPAVTSGRPEAPPPVARCGDLDQLEAELINPGARALAPGENAGERVMEAVREIGERNSNSFGGMWIDRETGAVVASFTTDLEARRGELLSIPGVGLVGLARAPASLESLHALREAIGSSELFGAAGPIIGIGTGENLGVVSVDVKVLDESTIARIGGRFESQRICIDGAEPDEVVTPGPQPDGGQGWRLLVDRPDIGRPWATGFAETEAELAALWSEIGLRSPIPQIDFSGEAVIWFGPAVSGSCRNIRLDAVNIDLERRTVIPVIVLPGGAAACTADANPHAYVVAVERERLPDRPFTIELIEDACDSAPGVCEEQRTTVD